MGVAKLRLIETLKPARDRLISDEYAKYHCSGAWIMRCMGIKLLLRLMKGFRSGIFEMLILRTRWLDELVLDACGDGGIRQVVILAAGYDMRGYRLELPAGVKVFEVDQPDVQSLKLDNIRRIRELPQRDVVHVPVDFNSQAIGDELCRQGLQSEPRAKSI